MPGFFYPGWDAVKLLIHQDWTICWQETGEIQELCKLEKIYHLIEVYSGNHNDQAHLPPSAYGMAEGERFTRLLFQFLDVVQLPRFVEERGFRAIESKYQEELFT
jgi:hypothetical protein